MGESKHDFVLPEKIYRLKREIIGDIYKLILSRDKLTIEEKLELSNKISKDRLSLIQESRKLIGVDELSNLNRKLFLQEKNINELMSKLSDFSTEAVFRIFTTYA